MRYLVLLISSVAVLGGCVAKNPATGGTDLAFMSEEKEFDLGHDVAVQAIKEFGGLYKEKPALNNYLQKITQDVVRVSERPDKRFEFKLLDDDILNAFAVPGYTMLSRGILPFFNSEAELVTVIGHEVGHVTARHFVRQHATNVLANVGLLAAQILVASRTNSQAAVDTTSQVGQIAASMGLASYSRSHELEADELGLRYMARLGYDPNLAANTFRMFERYGDMMNRVRVLAGKKEIETGFYHQLFSTHPRDDHRVKELVDQAHGAMVVGFKVKRERYFDMINGVAFGPRAEDGVAGHGRYYNKKERFTFDLPKHWFFPRLKGLPLAVQPEYKAHFKLEMKEVPVHQDAEETLFYNYPEVMEMQPVKAAGLDAFTGVLTTTGKNPDKHRVVAIRLPKPHQGADKAKAVIFKFMVAADKFANLDADFKHMINSFRYLSADQADAIEPLRVAIHTVKEGETQADIARLMAFSALHEDWLRTLNNLAPDAKLKPGQKLKIIIDPNRAKGI